MTETRASQKTQKLGIPPGSEDALPVVIVTGMSGAGRSTALKALEDLGYEAVDNLPLSLLSSLLTPGAGGGRPMAIGVDARTRNFGATPFLEELDGLIRWKTSASVCCFLIAILKFFSVAFQRLGGATR